DLEPLGNLRVEVKVDDIPLNQLAWLVGLSEIQGDLSGSLQAIVPGQDLKNTAAWQASARLSSNQVNGFGLNLRDFSAQLRLARGTLTLDDFQGKVQGVAVTAWG